MATDLAGSFTEHFSSIQDPRTRPVDHPLHDILFLAVCATIAGADGPTDIEEFGCAHEQDFQGHSTLEDFQGHSTLCSSALLDRFGIWEWKGCKLPSIFGRSSTQPGQDDTESVSRHRKTIWKRGAAEIAE